VKITSSSVAYSLSQAKVPQLQEELGCAKALGAAFRSRQVHFLLMSATIFAFFYARRLMWQQHPMQC
jgi:hypothetical protein